MATRVELPLETVRGILEKQIASLKRSSNTAQNQLLKKIYNDEIAATHAAQNSLTEVK